MKTKILVFPASGVEVKHWASCSEGSAGSRVLLKAPSILSDVLGPLVAVGQWGPQLFQLLPDLLFLQLLSLGPGIHVFLGERDRFLTHSACVVG